jgi:hypothetical protein
MESSSRTSRVEQTSHRTSHLAANKLTPQLANLLGTVVALLTLTVPLLAIAHFSASTQSVWQPATLIPGIQPGIQPDIQPERPAAQPNR